MYKSVCEHCTYNINFSDDDDQQKYSATNCIQRVFKRDLKVHKRQAKWPRGLLHPSCTGCGGSRLSAITDRGGHMALGIIFGDDHTLCFHICKMCLENMFQEYKKSNFFSLDNRKFLVYKCHF